MRSYPVVTEIAKLFYSVAFPHCALSKDLWLHLDFDLIDVPLLLQWIVSMTEGFLGGICYKEIVLQ